jgi:excinuclease ABC subunit A
MAEGLDYLKIRGAGEHNLKSVDLDLPKNKLIVFTGVSGSGKSSLAFDTIYAEGQRRYVESLSSYARQFLGIMDKPDVETIEGLSPAIAIDQKQPSRNPRSTVGTLTEIYDYLRLLFARVGHPHCPECGREIRKMSPQEITAAIRESFPSRRGGPGRRLLILAPLVKDRKGEYGRLFDNLRRDGFSQARVDGQIIDLASPPVLIKTNRHAIELVVERLILREETAESSARLNEAVERALQLAQGELIVAEVGDPSYEFPKEPKKMKDSLFSERFACPDCNLGLAEIEPRSFSFNSPHGACPACDGLGTQMKVDPELILAPKLTISEGGIIPLASTLSRDTWFARLVAQVAREHGFSTRQPLESLKRSQLQLLLYGTGERPYRVKGTNRFGRSTEIRETFSGVIPLLQRRYRELKSGHARAEIERFMRIDPCAACQGKRLKKEALSVTINEQNITEVTSLDAAAALDWVGGLEEVLAGREREIAASITKELTSRLNFLTAVGLDYLSLDRTASTLAGGEMQRIRLASQIGSGLSGVLYVLDEPSVGLHPRDQGRLLETLRRLRDLGNTVIVVEHDRDTIMAADVVVDFGPGAGSAGGEVVAVGTPEEISRSPASLTGKYLSGRRRIAIRKGSPQAGVGPELTLTGVRHHNLKNITVSFPLGKFICVTGVSGSGKSSLVEEVLYRAVAARYRGSRERPGDYDDLVGAEALENVVMVDQSPIGRTPRSNPATYTGAFTPIRELFSQTKEAKIRGYKPGRFSFNVKGGRCEACRGEGQLKIEMQFLPDIYVACEVCEGRRYHQQTLEIKYRGKNVADVLKMPVEEALAFFEPIPPIKNKLSTLNEVGLGYIELGQPAPTLSGGEAQRVKLANELSKRQSGKTLYLLDEPTTGLHFVDLERLLKVLFKLVSFGNTVVVIEHNLEVIKNADWIIDLGPEGGERGGEVVVAGPPDKVALTQSSHTGKALKNVLGI